MADVAQPPFAGDHRRKVGPAHGLGQGSGQFQDRAGPAPGDVEGAGHRAVGLEGGHVGPSDVAHVDEVAALAAVLEDPRRLAASQGGHEEAGHTGVGGVDRAPRPVDVVVAQRDDRHVATRVRRPCTGALGGAWWRRRRCAGRRARPRPLTLGDQSPPHARAGRLELPAAQPLGRAWAGTDRAAARAAVGALAVDHHAAGQHQPAAEADRRRGPPSSTAVPMSLSAT